MRSEPLEVPGQGESPTESSPNSSFVNCGLSLVNESIENLPIHQQMQQMDIHQDGADPEGTEEDSPLQLLPGETVESTTLFQVSTVFVTTYRVVVISSDGGEAMSLPLTSVEKINTKADCVLEITCKNGQFLSLTAKSTTEARDWYTKVAARFYSGSKIDQLFLWKFAEGARAQNCDWLEVNAASDCEFSEAAELERLQLDRDYFTVNTDNREFKLCESYPRELILPTCITSEDLADSATYRYLNRVTCIVWHSSEKKTTLLRASQPCSGLLWWRNTNDEKIVKACNDYYKIKRGAEAGKTVILDCRSYNASIANRVKGGGYENIAHYGPATISYLDMPNIHSVRSSFNSLRNILTPPVDEANFLQNLQGTGWFSNIALLLKRANEGVAHLLEKDTNVFVHCSDGWDRTTQIVAMIKLLADPYCRTIKGMEELIRRDWVAFGHKFADRTEVIGLCENEKAPIFLQWLDAVHQVMRKYPSEFEFNDNYLVKLAQHSYSGMFSTFAFNSIREQEIQAQQRSVKPLSLWTFLNHGNQKLLNGLFEPTQQRLHAPDQVQQLVLWSRLYCKDSLVPVPSRDAPEKNQGSKPAGANPPGMDRSLVKSKSSESITSGTSTCAADMSIISAVSPHRTGSPQSTQMAMNGQSGSGTNASLLQVPYKVCVYLIGSLEVMASVVKAPPSAKEISEYMFGSAREAQEVVQEIPKMDELSLQSARDLFDEDGLVKVIDRANDIALRIKKEKEALKQKVEDARRDNEALKRRNEAQSFKLDDKLGSKKRYSSQNDGDLERSGGEENTFLMEGISEHESLARTPSDASIVDPTEAYTQPFRSGMGMEIHRGKCSICHDKLTFLNNAHHCKSCGRSVCAKCSSNTFHDVDGGVSTMKRACNRCYEAMKGSYERQTSCPEESSSSSDQRRIPLISTSVKG